MVAVKAKKSKSSASASESGSTPRNVTLITTGYRSRARMGGGGASSIATVGKALKTQADLQTYWEGKINNIDSNVFVPGAGEPGIFSAQFAEQVQQIADLDNVYCPSAGLGMVCLGASYPQYNLGEYDANMTGIIEDFDQAEWWKNVTSMTQTMSAVVLAALARGHRVIIAIAGQQWHRYKADIAELAENTETLKRVLTNVRFVGPGLDTVLPPKLLPCAMPYGSDETEDALDIVVPGSSAHGTRRAAMLLLKVCGVSADGASSPRKDYEKMQAALDDPTSMAPIAYLTGSKVNGGKRQALSDEDARLLIKTALKTTVPDSKRIMRMIKDQGYTITVERVEELLKKSSDDAEAAPARRRKAA